MALGHLLQTSKAHPPYLAIKMAVTAPQEEQSKAPSALKNLVTKTDLMVLNNLPCALLPMANRMFLHLASQHL